MNLIISRYRKLIALSSFSLLFLISCSAPMPNGMRNGSEMEGMEDHHSMMGSGMHDEEMSHMEDMHTDDGANMMGEGAQCSEEEMHADGSGCADGEMHAEGMMGMDHQSMMARHHATIPDDYTNLTNPIPADEGSIERGAEIYVASCAVCHGESGMGDGSAAVGLDPKPAPIVHTGEMMSDSYLFWRISEGGAADPFNSAMPSWKGSLTEESRWDLINYIQNMSR